MNSTFLNLSIPILQSPIGGASNPELCVAVSDAGGMGGMALSWTEPEEARHKVARVISATDAPFYVNFALAFTPESLPAALEAGAPCVTFSWGNPSEYAPLVKSFGAKVGVQVASAAEMRQALDTGADFLICQGIEAGGHVQSQMRLAALLELARSIAVGVPIVASGGIATGAQIAAALKSGASAVAMGTRFLASRESGAHPEYKRLVASDSSIETALTTCFDIGWPNAPHRILTNSTFNAWQSSGSEEPGRRPGEHEVLARNGRGIEIYRYDSEQPLEGTVGDIEAMCLYAGESCRYIREILPAKDILTGLWRESQECL